MAKIKIDPNRHPMASVAVFVVQPRKRGYVLVGERYYKIPGNKKFQNCIPGGKVDWMEDTEEAAIREVKEETGLTVKIKKFLGFKDEMWPNLDEHYTCLYFLAIAAGGKLFTDETNPEAYKQGNWTWVDVKKMPTLFGMATPMLLKNMKYLTE
jgi:ADP-ribose pyrophosphatase YjhB (NUDIX family)